MNTLKSVHQKEPVLTWGLIAAVFNALQLLVIPGIPLWVHSAIVVVATIASVIAARSQSVPANDPEAIVSAAKELGVIAKVVEHA